MTSKLALHVQGHEGWTANSHARFIKVIDPPVENKWPRQIVVGRVYIPDGEANAMIERGAAGADEWFARVLPMIRNAAYVNIWELPNEPQPVADLEFCHRLADFTVRAAALLHGIGKQVVGGNLSEGNPGGNETERAERFVAIARGLTHCEWWSQHCYWVMDYAHPEAGMNDWHAFRYRLNIAAARAAGIELPRLMLTEVGIDGGVVGVRAKGWQTFCRGDWQAYQAQLAQFDAGLREDDEVDVAFVFTAGANNDWADFGISEWNGAVLDAYIDAQGGPYVPKPPQVAPVSVVAQPAGEVRAAVTAFSQRDARWQADRLGTSSVTLGQAGCAVTALASLLRDWGAETDPQRLNAWLRVNNGFAQGNLLRWASVAALGAQFVELIRCETMAAPVERLAQYLATGYGVIVQVDATPGGALDGHWVRLMTLAARSGHIVDPWQLPGGELTSLERYLSPAGWTAARGLFAAAVYRRGGATRGAGLVVEKAAQEQLALRGRRGGRA